MAFQPLPLDVNLATKGLLGTAPAPRFCRGDTVAIEVRMFSPKSTNFNLPVAFPDGALVFIAIGKPGDVPTARAPLTVVGDNGRLRSGSLPITKALADTFLDGAVSKSATLEIEISEGDGTITTVCQTNCTLYRDIIVDGGDDPPPAPSLSVLVAALIAESQEDRDASEAAKVAAEAARDEAITAKNTAVTKAGEAATSEANAATSESNAANSASAAGTSESNAATSESNAATSAAAAAASASAADAKMPKVTVATGEVMINAGGSAVNSGYSIAPAKTFAGDNQLVVGSDPRLGIKGGQHLDGGVLACPGLTVIPNSGTVSFLVRLTDTATAQCLFGNHYPDVGYGNMEVSVEADGRLRVSVSNGDNSGKTGRTLPAGTITFGGWTRIAFTYAPGALAVYVNGALINGTLDVNTYSGFVSLAFGNPLRFGAFYGSFPYYMHGDIASAYFNSAVLGADDLAASYAGEFSPDVLATMAFRCRQEDALLTGNWPDSSGKCHDLRPTGTVTSRTERESYTRVIAVTVGGATVTAGTVASVGAVSGVATYDTAAIAAMRQWDAVSATWAQARPANAGPLNAEVTAAGVLLLETGAFGSNAVVGVAAAIKITHTQR